LFDGSYNFRSQRTVLGTFRQLFQNRTVCTESQDFPLATCWSESGANTFRIANKLRSASGFYSLEDRNPPHTYR